MKAHSQRSHSVGTQNTFTTLFFLNPFLARRRRMTNEYAGGYPYGMWFSILECEHLIRACQDSQKGKRSLSLFPSVTHRRSNGFSLSIPYFTISRPNLTNIFKFFERYRKKLRFSFRILASLLFLAIHFEEETCHIDCR